ncbi:MAG: N-acetyltransferase family protein, partial [Syntrophothermus sp.]
MLAFDAISRAEAPAAVQASAEFREACPASATVMLLDLVYVEREQRGTGIGFALMAGLIERARALSYHKLALTTFPQNTAAVRLYERCGFRTVGDYR